MRVTCGAFCTPRENEPHPSVLPAGEITDEGGAVGGCRTTEEVGLADEAAMGPYRRLCGGVGGCAHPAHPPAIGDSIYLPGCRASAS